MKRKYRFKSSSDKQGSSSANSRSSRLIAEATSTGGEISELTASKRPSSSITASTTTNSDLSEVDESTWVEFRAVATLRDGKVPPLNDILKALTPLGFLWFDDVSLKVVDDV